MDIKIWDVDNSWGNIFAKHTKKRDHFAVFFCYTFIQRNFTSRKWTLDRYWQWYGFPTERHIIHLTNLQHQTVRSGREPTHHRGSPAANDVWARFEDMAVHDAGACECQRCQIESQEDDDVGQQHYHLEILEEGVQRGLRVTLFSFIIFSSSMGVNV